MKLVDINEDKRGFIKALVEDLQTIPEITVFKTKAGLARGGCIHPTSWEHLCVAEGSITYVYQDARGIQSKNLHAGQSITIPPNVPHYFRSITDSVVLEWGPSIAEKQGKHEEFRKIVLGINEHV